MAGQAWTHTPKGIGMKRFPTGPRTRALAAGGNVTLRASLIVTFLLAFGCGAINAGKWLGVQKSDPDVKYYLVKDTVLTPGSSYLSKEFFDHNMNEVINLLFTVVNEKNHYVAESRWIDPIGVEFRTIRTTHDRQQEGKQDIDRRATGTTRMHSIFTKPLFDHKPGQWKVELFIDGELARRMPFTVR